jgi:rare lipoprotein A (peptidoglycan hydrolase)
MKSYLVAFLLAAGALISAALPAAADQDQMTWASLTKSTPTTSAPKATAAKSAPKPAAVKAVAVKAAPIQATPKAKPTRTASSDDGSRPQRKAATKPAPARTAVTSNGGGTLSGIASYYWQPQPVASGGRFNPDALTAAHKTLPFGTRVRVTHGSNGRSVEVVINDRGPYIAGRIIDLSRRAAQVIGMTDQGIARVNVAILGK